MEKDLKLAYGYLLGQIFRMQKRMRDQNGREFCQASDATIFGLLNGVEHIIEENIPQDFRLTRAEFQSVMDVLEPYWKDPTKVQSFNGFYDIEDQLSARGVDREKAHLAFKILLANDQFEEVIRKMDSTGSPSEMRLFEMDDFDS